LTTTTTTTRTWVMERRRRWSRARVLARQSAGEGVFEKLYLLADRPLPFNSRWRAKHIRNFPIAFYYVKHCVSSTSHHQPISFPFSSLPRQKYLFCHPEAGQGSASALLRLHTLSLNSASLLPFADITLHCRKPRPADLRADGAPTLLASSCPLCDRHIDARSWTQAPAPSLPPPSVCLQTLLA